MVGRVGTVPMDSVVTVAEKLGRGRKRKMEGGGFRMFEGVLPRQVQQHGVQVGAGGAGLCTVGVPCSRGVHFTATLGVFRYSDPDTVSTVLHALFQLLDSQFAN